MNFEQGQTAVFTTDWGGVYEAKIVAVLPEGSKYQYAVEYTDEDDGETVADFADADNLKSVEPSLTLTEPEMQELKNILRTARDDHKDKFQTDCSCLNIIETWQKRIETALRGRA